VDRGQRQGVSGFLPDFEEIQRGFGRSPAEKRVIGRFYKATRDLTGRIHGARTAAAAAGAMQT
jgi:hypothetical protein